MSVHVKDAGAWKQVNKLWVRDAGTWKEVSTGYAKDGGVWKEMFSSYALPSANTISDFASPGSAPSGLAFDGTNLISCDSSNGRIYVHDGVSSAILTSFDAPDYYSVFSGSYIAKPQGLTFDGTNLISCDSSEGEINVHDAVSSTVVTDFESPGTTPYGLTFDGTNLISCDVINDRIYVHDGVSDTILTNFPSPGQAPTGLAFDGTNLISCDNADIIYVHDGVSSAILTSFNSEDAAPAGLAFDGSNLISCSQDAAEIYVHGTQ